MDTVEFSTNCGIETNTTYEQRKVEEDCVELIFKDMGLTSPEGRLKLRRNEHFKFLAGGLIGLSSGFQSLDASKPWILYWIVHSLDLLGLLSPQLAPRILSVLKACEHPTGGYSGGPGQIPHLAATYAAVHATIILGGVYPEAYQTINRSALFGFLKRMKQEDGSFTLHEDGEVDIRGAYCALSSAALTNILSPEIVEGTAEWIGQCQTHEGGLAGNPENEAHGGYAFCGLAALGIIGNTSTIDLNGLARWAVMRQMRLEGGFQGRVNKLVDACYSFWVGGLFPILAEIGVGGNDMLLNRERLQQYILLCCQSDDGGLIDKPGKRPDFYHSCYALSGLSIAQYGAHGPDIVNVVEGPPSNVLRSPLHPLHNLCLDRFTASQQYFSICEQAMD